MIKKKNKIAKISQELGVKYSLARMIHKIISHGEALPDPVKKAMKFALFTHKGQMYGNNPYIYHLKNVDEVLCRFGFKKHEELRMGAYLHDVIEDTETSASTIKGVFGNSVAKMIDAVTDLPGADKEQLFREKTRNINSAVILKAADRIANIEQSLSDGNIKMIAKYWQEMDLFFDVLRINIICPQMGNYLQYLAGRMLWKLEENQKVAA